MVIQTFTSMFTDLFSKDYKRGLAKMSPDEVNNCILLFVVVH